MPDWRQYVRTQLPSMRLRPERECEVVEELAAQLEQAYQDALRAGNTSASAETHAKVRFPDWSALARNIETAGVPLEREPWKPLQPLLSGVPVDVRQAFRGLKKDPGFALVAILTLAMGIGGCTAIFSLLDAVVLRSIGYRQAEQLVMVWENQVKNGNHHNVVAMADYLDWRARSHSFSALCPILDQIWNLTDRGQPAEITGISSNQDFLRMLGVQPVIGRNFVPAETKFGGPAAAILSHRLWMGRFGGDRNALGQTLMLDGTPVQVVGVLPADFPWLGKPLDVLTVLQVRDRDWRKQAGRFMRVAGRLKPRITVAQAQRELDVIARQLELEYPEFNKDWGVDVVPMADHFAGGASTALWILMAAISIVLLIACSNVANLLLARAAVREREMALRAALGGTSGRLVRLLLVESLTIALCGGVLGTAVAYLAIRLVQVYGPRDLTRIQLAQLNVPVIVFALSASLFTGIAFGLAPTLTSLRVNLSATLKEGARGIVSTARGRLMRSSFVVAQIALALILLTSASLLLQSLIHLANVPIGFDPNNVLTASISFSGKSSDQFLNMCRNATDRLKQLPGVESASFITFLPFAGMGAATNFQVEGRTPYAPGQAPVTDVRVVRPGYFETMRIPLIRGRLFSDNDNAPGQPRAFIVNQTLSKKMFGSDDPLGRHLIVQMGDDKPGVIVGVVGDIKSSTLDGEIRPMVYYPQAHLPVPFGAFVVRTRGNPEALTQSVIAAIQNVKKDQPVFDVQTMDQWISATLARQRFETGLLTAFAALALILAITGVYGVMSYMVEQRSHEIGVRLALGADPGALKTWITAQGMGVAAIGLGLGLLGAALSTHTLKSLLFEITPGDPLTFSAAGVVLALVCLGASYIPARRATRVDPLQALRWE